MMKRRIDVEHLSDLEQRNGMPGYNMPHIRRVYPQLFSNVTVGVQPVSQPQGIYYALRHLYSNDRSLKDFELKKFKQKNETPEMEIKPKTKHHYKLIVNRVLLRPKNWNANPGKNESRQKHKFYK